MPSPTQWRPGRRPGPGLVSFYRSPGSTFISGFLPESALVPEMPLPSPPFERWAAMTGQTTGAAPYLPTPPDLATWALWARALVLTPSLQAYALPPPEPFGDDWLAWAMAARRAFTGL
jgi:hypothetical protein